MVQKKRPAGHDVKAVKRFTQHDAGRVPERAPSRKGFTPDFTRGILV